MKPSALQNIESRVCALPVTGEMSPEALEIATHNILTFRSYHLLRTFSRGDIVGACSGTNMTAMSQNCLLGVLRSLRRSGVAPVICDTTTDYRDTQWNAVGRLHTLRKLFAESDAPIVMLDGLKGTYEIVRRAHHDLPEARIAGELPSLQGAVLVSCPQIHPQSGLSGALVNLGLGFASRRGKIRHHAMNIPHVHQEKCYTCRRCLRECPVHAISMADGHVVIDPERCINCGRCVEIAHFGGITYEWDATSKHFCSTLTAHALAALETLRKRVVFISILNLPATKAQRANQVLLFSRDPVAIDAATMKLFTNHDLLDQSHAQRTEQLIEQATEAGIGTARLFIEYVAF
ncbi:MAG: DUF362 domain-containing protein [Kiritimatiellae bacterium]|nr:DUF362 domain-containing protein [Kiritimatiellia bacterium]